MRGVYQKECKVRRISEECEAYIRGMRGVYQSNARRISEECNVRRISEECEAYIRGNLRRIRGMRDVYQENARRVSKESEANTRGL